MDFHIEQREEILGVCSDDRQIVLESIAPYHWIARAAKPDVRHRYSIAAQRCHTRHQRGRQVLIEKEFHAGDQRRLKFPADDNYFSLS